MRVDKRGYLICLLFANAVGEPFPNALDMTFALQSSSLGVSNHEAVMRSVTDLMIRHGIPTDARALRNTSDERLLQLAMVAAVGSISNWRRANEGQFLVDERGALLRMYSPGAVESDIMLCIVCTLLAIVVMFHIVAAPPPPPPPPPPQQAAAQYPFKPPRA